MARTPKSGETPLSGLSARDVTRVNKVALAASSSDEFGEAFAEDPVLALSAKGIEITPAEAEKIRADLGKLGGSPGSVSAVEVGVVVKKKF